MKKFLIFFFSVFFASMPAVGYAMECVDLSTNLKQGMRSGEVTKLQTFLKETGYLATNPTGYFGTQTLRAVKRMQKDNTLPETGFVGILTRASVKKITCTTSVVPTPATPIVAPNEPSVTTPSNDGGDTPVMIVNSTPVVVEDAILPIGNPSSLRVRTEGVGGVSKDSIIVKGVITAGVRSGTVSWFELTKNSEVYKKLETTISKNVIQRTNDKSFQETFTGLQSNTTYYFRVCAGNDGLGQRSCGTTVSVKTLE